MFHLSFSARKSALLCHNWYYSNMSLRSPGTGKTVTIVEAIRQILNKDPQARVLACAPSNGAADVIAERLLDLGSDVLFRLNAPSRNPKHLPPSLNSIVFKDVHGQFSVAGRAQLERFRVIVSTCGSASIPHGIGMRRGWFTHVFIDEAGQCTEPEVRLGSKDSLSLTQN